MPSDIVQAMLATHAALEQLGIPIALMGGLALSGWDRIRATEDVDFLIGADATNPDTLLRALQDRGYAPKKLPAVTNFDGERVMQLRYQPPGKFFDYLVDLFFAESEYHRTALARRVSFRLPDGKTVVPIVSCEDLIIFKLRADRPVDRGDVIGLLEANRDKLDF
ncbi:MAG TPA: nucleotidyl transferase AbiEii/AbiGii toxin family protein, partial [Gemmataceae bacterium]|nr:nucleotidyl transferase AbiEii/AbiGii toxin family protein [Gemmataceae bacterium]